MPLEAKHPLAMRKNGCHPFTRSLVALNRDCDFSEPRNSYTVSSTSNFTVFVSITAAPIEQINAITSWVDASNVYGSSLDEANSLRDLSDPERGLRTCFSLVWRHMTYIWEIVLKVEWRLRNLKLRKLTFFCPGFARKMIAQVASSKLVRVALSIHIIICL